VAEMQPCWIQSALHLQRLGWGRGLQSCLVQAVSSGCSCWIRTPGFQETPLRHHSLLCCISP
jgi:hypothetical protein